MIGLDVILLQISGGSDTDLQNLTANDLMKWGLANLWEEGREGGYAVRHGQEPVRDFPSMESNMNFFERAFPILFSYGRGGPEAARPCSLSLQDHIRWTLQYHDRRFRKHEIFSFVVFGILQKRQALGSARLQMERRSFDRDAHILSRIRPQDLLKAQEQEMRQEPITDAGVKLLFSHIHATAARVMGSDVARYRNRSKMWSTTVSLNPPSLWITINLSDLHDPIAQIFAGEKIDMDNFQRSLGPTSEQRAKNIAADPYAAASFFHFMIRRILQSLFGIERSNYQVKAKMGLLGQISSYFGMVESQGRGSLHLHMQVWLEDAPTSSQMHEMLQDEHFRSRVCKYIDANIHAYIPGGESSTSIKMIQNEVDIGYGRALDPDDTFFSIKNQELEYRVARAKQIHKCEVGTCLVPDKHGRLRCKRHAPFPCFPTSFIDCDGNWGPKRHYEFLNAWMPSISTSARCNNDIKLLTNGKDTKDCTFYTTTYASKDQNKSHNLSAITTREFAYQEVRPKQEHTLKEQQRLLLFRLVNRINSEQELSGPMVISLLMGWGDHYNSHNYTVVYWSSFVSFLFSHFPNLRT